MPLAGPVSGPAAKWNTVVAASRAGESSSSAGPAAIAARGVALADLLGEEFVAAFAKAIKKHSGGHVALALTRETERLPWELLAVGTRTLAEAAPVFRLPVGISTEARGLPSCASPMRALLIGDTLGADASLALPGAVAEVKDAARAIEASGLGTTRLLLGKEATFDAVRLAFEEWSPDIVHFAGHAWFDDHEAFLYLADHQLATASMLRPWLSVAPPTFMFLSSHYTAFIPPGVEKDAPTPGEAAIRAGPGGRAGFADIAMRSGVGAFLGTFSGAVTDPGAQAFAVSVYGELLKGATMAEAVQRSRRLPSSKEDPTPLLFALHGAGTLRLA